MLAAIPMPGGNYTPPAMPELDEREFASWVALLEERLGIAVPPQRKAFLSSKLRMRMRELGIDNFQRYYEYVTAPKSGQVEWSRLLDRLTIHETRFKRHHPSFCLLEEEYLPALLQRQADDEILNIRAWSVGCASGEEAYSLAMMLDAVLGAHPGRAYFGVIGSDISLDSLAEARAGIYAESRLSGLDDDLMSRYFEPCEGGYKVDGKLRQRVAFSQLNVQNLSRAPLEKVDIIFCQNLLIYFSQQRRLEIVSELAGFLKPGGLLVLGVGEVVHWRQEGFEAYKYEDTLAYQRVKD